MIRADKEKAVKSNIMFDWTSLHINPSVLENFKL